MFTLTKGDRLIEVSHRIERDPWRVLYDLSSMKGPDYASANITFGLTSFAFGRMLNTAARLGYEIYVS